MRVETIGVVERKLDKRGRVSVARAFDGSAFEFKGKEIEFAVITENEVKEWNGKGKISLGRGRVCVRTLDVQGRMTIIGALDGSADENYRRIVNLAILDINQ